MSFNDIRLSVGANYSPQTLDNEMTDLLNNILGYISKNESLNRTGVEDLLTIFSPSNNFIKELSLFAKDPHQFQADAAKLYSLQKLREQSQQRQSEQLQDALESVRTDL